MLYLLLGFLFTILLGYLISYLFLKSTLAWERIALSPALGFGVVSLLLFFIFLFEFLTTKNQLLSTLAGLCVILIVVYRGKLFLNKRENDRKDSSLTLGSYVLWCIILLLFGLSLWFSSAYPIFITDGNDYEATGRLIALNKTIEREYFFRPYSPLVPLIYSFVYFLGGTHPKVVFSIFYLSLIVLFYITMKDEIQSQRLTIIFAAIIATTPFFWWHSYLGLLNFTAGYFFVLGCFYFIRFFGSQEDTGKLIVSGIGFGLAAFTRFEYLVYFLAPFVVFIFQGEKNLKKVLAFFTPALLPPTLWSIYSAISLIGKRNIYSAEETLVVLIYWCVLVLYVVGKAGSKNLAGFKWQKMRRPLFFGLWLFILLIGVLCFRSKIAISLHLLSLDVVLRTGICIVFRLLAGNIFWLFTLSLLGLLFFKPFREAFKTRRVITTSFLIGAYYLLHIFIHTYHTYSNDPAGAHPYHVSLLANLKWIFLTPGNFFNTSEVRDLIAINPLVVFLCGLICREAKIREKGRILLLRFLACVVWLNLFTLTVFFLYPRLSFLYEYRGASLREVLFSSGPQDSPNMEHLRDIYKLLYFVKDHSTEDSVVYFISPKFNLAQVSKILLPRKVCFCDQYEVESLLTIGQKRDSQAGHLVFKIENTPHLVEGRKIVWYDKEWGIYRMW